MEKKELTNIEPELQPQPSGLTAKVSGLAGKAFSLVKLILGICLLPLVYSMTASFLNEIGMIENGLQETFWAGAITLALVHLFLWEPAVIYAKGQKLLELIFSFFRPMVRFAPYLLPIYAIVLFIIYSVLSLMINSRWLIEDYLFLLGVSFALHIIFSAKTLRSKKNDYLKANYIFGFSFVYIVNIFLISFFINLLFKEFSLVHFCNSSFLLYKQIFISVFKQLF